ncbi:MAG: hypothetical protein WAL66_18780 [Nitrososphaeraceae archaeon]
MYRKDGRDHILKKCMVQPLVTCTFIDSYHSLCLDKKDILNSELIACERLLKYTLEEYDIPIIEKEIADLKMTLDLLS